jgi:homoserine kinase
MNSNQIKVYTPASIANLGPGFDVFGLAISDFGDNITLEVIRERSLSVEIKSIDSGSIPTDAESNSAGAVLSHIINDRDLDHGLRLLIEKGVPTGKGLCSSGASAVAAAYAVNDLLGLNNSLQDIIKLASIGEASGNSEYVISFNSCKN